MVCTYSCSQFNLNEDSWDSPGAWALFIGGHNQSRWLPTLRRFAQKHERQDCEVSVAVYGAQSLLQSSNTLLACVGHGLGRYGMCHVPHANPPTKLACVGLRLIMMSKKSGIDSSNRDDVSGHGAVS